MIFDKKPDTWEIKKIGELFNVQQGISMSPSRRDGPNKCPFLRTLNVFWRGIDLTTIDYMDFSEKEIEKLNLLPGDLLVCEGGDIGRTAMWRGELETCCYQNHLHRLRVKNNDVNPEFVAFWMQAAIKILGFYKDEGNKTTIPNLSQSRLKNFDIPLPPLPEQHAIANTLRTVQEVKEKTNTVIEAIKAFKATMIEHLFTYGPVPPEDAERVVLKETEIGQVPEGWEIQTIDVLFDSKLGKMLSPVSKTGKFSKPYLRNANVQWGRVDISDLYEMDFSENCYDRYGLIPGDVLICEGGEIGRTAIWRGEIKECYYQKAIHRLRPRDNRISPEFFSYHMMNAFLIGKTYPEAGTTTTIAHLPGMKLKSLSIPVPPRKEQDIIVTILNSIDQKLTAEQFRMEALNTLFTSLLHDLMTAKIRVIND
jgi:type I restriction enzyme S subunit